MFLMRELWLWILIALGFSQDWRARVGKLGRSSAGQVKILANWIWEEIGLRIICWSIIVLLLALVFSLLGFVWPLVWVMACLLVAVWFLLLYSIMDGAVSLIQAGGKSLEQLLKGLFENPAIISEEVKATLSGLLKGIIAPVRWLALAAALIGFLILVFNKEANSIILFILTLLALAKLAKLGPVMTAGRINTILVIGSSLFFSELWLATTPLGGAVREVISSQSRKNTALVNNLGKKIWKQAIGIEHSGHPGRFPEKRFEPLRYESRYLEPPPIFYGGDKRGQRVSDYDYPTVLASLQKRPQVVIRDQTMAEIPLVMKLAVGDSLDWTEIQVSPIRPEERYIVPSWCFDWGKDDDPREKKAKRRESYVLSPGERIVATEIGGIGAGSNWFVKLFTLRAGDEVEIIPPSWLQIDWYVLSSPDPRQAERLEGPYSGGKKVIVKHNGWIYTKTWNEMKVSRDTPFTVFVNGAVY